LCAAADKVGCDHCEKFLMKYWVTRGLDNPAYSSLLQYAQCCIVSLNVVVEEFGRIFLLL
jgi:hypothetical protein